MAGPCRRCWKSTVSHKGQSNEPVCHDCCADSVLLGPHHEQGLTHLAGHRCFLWNISRTRYFDKSCSKEQFNRVMTHSTRQSKAILPFHFGVHMQDPGQKPTLHVHAFSSFILDCRFYTVQPFFYLNMQVVTALLISSHIPLLLFTVFRSCSCITSMEACMQWMNSKNRKSSQGLNALLINICLYGRSILLWSTMESRKG